MRGRAWSDDVRRARENRPPVLRVPAPTLADGAGFLVLWAEFTGRAEVTR